MADYLLAPTQFILDAIQPYVDITAKNKIVIRNPYIVPDHKAVESIERNKIVYYGKLSPQKGSFELLSYFKKMWDTGFTTSVAYHRRNRYSISS